MGTESLTMIKQEIAEKASGAAMGRRRGMNCSRQVNVTREHSVASCFAVVANKLDEESHPSTTAPQATVFAVGTATTYHDIDIVRQHNMNLG
jgi:hypothetical protein